jgi:hypothetical protein
MFCFEKKYVIWSQELILIMVFICIPKDPKIRGPLFSKKQYLKRNFALYSGQ